MIDSTADELVRRYFLLSGLYTLSASVIWGINTLFLLDAGFTIREVFVINAAFSVGTMLFEIPTGVVADTLGRRASFLASVGILAATTIAYVLLAATEGGVIGFIVVSIVMGLGFTFYSGATEAWLVDGLAALGFDGQLDSIFSRAQMITGSAMLLGTVGGGLLGQIDLALPFWVRSGLLFLLFILAATGMRDIGFERTTLRLREIPKAATRLASEGIRFGLASRPMRLLMAAGAIQMGFFVWAWYAWQPYFLELLEREAVWVAGVVAALLSVAMMLGNGISEWATRRCGRRSTLFLLSGSIFSATMVGVGITDRFGFALPLLLLGWVAFGVQTPVKQAFVHETIPSETRSTVVSLDSLVSGGLGVVGQTGLGSVAERRSLSAGYVIGGLATITAVPVLFLLRRLRPDADFYGGTAESSCAIQGLPAIAQVQGTDVISGNRPER